MSVAKEIRSLIAEMEAVRRELADELQKISADTYHSDSMKARMREEALEKARADLARVHEQVEGKLPTLEALSTKQKAFSYSDPRLLAAVQFIEANGGAIPEPAWKQMISDFAGRPSELFYLASLFEKHGVIDGAITAKEAANEIAISNSLPQRLADQVYFITQTDPTAHVDTSGLAGDLDALERYESHLTDGGQDDQQGSEAE